jgi:hypothetical protein
LVHTPEGICDDAIVHGDESGLALAALDHLAPAKSVVVRLRRRHDRLRDDRSIFTVCA